jgi:long-chain fatty acid transport protein
MTAHVRTTAILLSILIVPSVGMAQTNVEVSQGIQFEFRNPGARSLGMGGAFVGLADDVTAALANPAGLKALSKLEVTVEGRLQELITPFVFGGRVSGTPSNLGIDRVGNPIIREANTRQAAPAFVSVAWASAKRPLAIAAYRHQTVNFRTEIRTDGAFNDNPLTPIGNRYYPVVAESDLKIANYGVAASYNWRRCKTDSTGARTCADVVSVGAGASLYDFNLDSTTTRYDDILMSVDSFIGPATYNRPFNLQTEQGSGRKVGGNVGIMVAPTRKFQLGASVRYAPKFDYSVVLSLSNDTTPLNESATFSIPLYASFGGAFRPTDATVLVVDYQRVGYSKLGSSTRDIFALSSEAPRRYIADDANQVHFGVEHQFLNSKVTPALRFGAWYDPDHAVRSADAKDPLFRAGEDVWHYTGGFGIVFGRMEISAAGDFSRRGNLGSASMVVRF